MPRDKQRTPPPPYVLLALAIALFALTLATYIPSMRNGFIWDDPQYVVDNPTLKSAEGLWRIWTDPWATPQYYPMVHTTFWIEARFWGTQNAAGFHVDNILLHALAVVLLWRALARLGVGWPWFAAAVFAVHPVMVESVTWVTERKNVLSVVFYLLAFHAYYLSGAMEQKPLRRGWYFAALNCFLLALLSKTVTCSLPAAILLVIWWKRGKLAWVDLKPLLPMFVVGAALSAFTGHLEHTHVGARGPDFNWSIIDRCLIAGHAICFYCVKLVWPHPLIFMYPKWDLHDPAGFAYPCIVMIVVTAAWAARRRIGRGPLVAVLFFIGTLVPALGFVNVYPMRYSFVADHFQYLASIGIITLCATTLGTVLKMPAPALRKRLSTARLAAVPKGRSSNLEKRPFGTAAKRGNQGDQTDCAAEPAPMQVTWGAMLVSALVLSPLVWLTIRQQLIYMDQRTLWENTIAQNETCWMAHVNLAGVYGRAKQADAAMAQSQRALQLAPNEADTQYDVGVALAERKHWQAAADRFRKAVECDPQCAQAWSYLARVLWEHDGTPQAQAEALTAAQRALAINPDLSDAHYVLARVDEFRGDLQGAVGEYTKALSINPDDYHTHYNLGTCLLQTGHPGEAAGEFEKVLSHDANDAPSLTNLGFANLMVGRRKQAIDCFDKALLIKPDLGQAKDGLNRAKLQ